MTLQTGGQFRTCQVGLECWVQEDTDVEREECSLAKCSLSSEHSKILPNPTLYNVQNFLTVGFCKILASYKLHFKMEEQRHKIIQVKAKPKPNTAYNSVCNVWDLLKGLGLFHFSWSATRSMHNMSQKLTLSTLPLPLEVIPQSWQLQYAGTSTATEVTPSLVVSWALLRDTDPGTWCQPLACIHNTLGAAFMPPRLIPHGRCLYIMTCILFLTLDHSFFVLALKEYFPEDFTWVMLVSY